MAVSALTAAHEYSSSIYKHFVPGLSEKTQTSVKKYTYLKKGLQTLRFEVLRIRKITALQDIQKPASCLCLFSRNEERRQPKRTGYRLRRFLRSHRDES